MNDETITGSMRATGTTGTTHVEAVFPTDADDLWSAITEPARLARWIAEVRGDLRIGGEVWQRYSSGWEGTSLIEVCDPPRLLRIRTIGERSDEGDALEVRLVPEATGTRLIVEDSGLSIAALPFHTAGWQAHLEDLGGYLDDGRPIRWRERWSELSPLYQRLPIDGA